MSEIWASVLGIWDLIDWLLLAEATYDTILMVLITVAFTVLFGLPLGVLLFLLSPGQLLESKRLYSIVSFFVNVLRSIPFIILLVIAIPLTQALTGTTIGVKGIIPPLVLSATPYFARLVQNVIRQLDLGIIEACKSMGATTWQTVYGAIIPEAIPGILGAITVTTVSIIGYTAMGGVVGAGGLGDVAIRYGYNRFEPVMLWSTVPIIVLIVQFVEFTGDRLIRKFDRKK
ncbi:metal ABC transporter permease [Psittacicella melopsittaci]|uniref:Probable D-methionine transport system permease protein MetI n=1 Tax=Psittacicella melopsittaci TaxID=2028576 RepID=A0A3A1Y4G9_9GAMM|nr:methionine ABC transporter permease [Psittacicella melopsittaci]RIY32465.1 metal ABC transporter permease [Psittacicella melopsittaci]